MVLLKYNKYIKDRRYVHPTWAIDGRMYEWKISSKDGIETIVCVKDIKYTENTDINFNMTQLDITSANNLVEEWSDGEYNILQDADSYSLLKKTEFVEKYVWADSANFESEFTFEELVGIYNYETIISNNTTLTDPEKLETKMTMKTIMDIYYKTGLLNKEFWNTDKRLQEILYALFIMGFLTKDRVNEILKFEYIKE